MRKSEYVNIYMRMCVLHDKYGCCFVLLNCAIRRLLVLKRVRRVSKKKKTAVVRSGFLLVVEFQKRCIFFFLFSHNT